jgi:hypothetical protein
MEQSPLMCGGAHIRQSEKFKYLRMWLHHKDWFATAGQSMAEAAEKSLWAMLRLYRSNDIQFEFEFVYIYTLAGVRNSKATDDTVTAFRGR